MIAEKLSQFLPQSGTSVTSNQIVDIEQQAQQAGEPITADIEGAEEAMALLDSRENLV